MESSTNPFLELAGMMTPGADGPVLFSARVTALQPFSILAHGLSFAGQELRINAALTKEPEEGEEPFLRIGDSVLCATADGWQTIYVICKVVSG